MRVVGAESRATTFYTTQAMQISLHVNRVTASLIHIRLHLTGSSSHAIKTCAALLNLGMCWADLLLAVPSDRVVTSV